MQVIIDIHVHQSIEQFYKAALHLHPTLDEATVENKKERLYAALELIGQYPNLFPIARYKRTWRAAGYREMIAEDFHFGYKVYSDVDGTQYVIIHDAIHSLLYHN